MNLLGGRYAVERRIGEGGMAEVLLARDTLVSDQQVVIKRCRAHLKHQPEFAELFLREARLASLVHHENVVRVERTGEDDGQPYLVMEYLQGFTVRDIYLRATQEGPIAQDIVAAIILGAARGLSAAHTAVDEQGRLIGLVHRDVSPHNLFLTDHGVVKVLDFGIAKGANDVTMTRSGHVKGKASYLAPEQLKEQTKVDPRTDLFSLGTVAWELFTAQRLFRRATETETINAIRKLEVPDPRRLRPELDAEYAATIVRLLARRPADRPPSAADAAGALQSTLARRSPQLDAAQLAQFVAHIRELAPIEEASNSVPVPIGLSEKSARQKEFAEAWGADGPSITQAFPPPSAPSTADRPQRYAARSASRVPSAKGARPSTVRVRTPFEEATATVAPPAAASWTSATGEPASADGSVVGTWAVAGAPRHSSVDFSGGFESTPPSSPPPSVEPAAVASVPPPRDAPQPPRSTPSNPPRALDRLLRARPKPIVIAGILLGSLLAGMIMAFVLTKLLS